MPSLLNSVQASAFENATSGNLPSNLRHRLKVKPKFIAQVTPVGNSF